jgi:acyl carrier protein
MNREDLQKEVRETLVSSLMLKLKAEEIRNDAPLFGPNGIGLDSIDALQLVVALEKKFGLMIKDSGAGQKILQSVDTIVDGILNQQSPQASP